MCGNGRDRAQVPDYTVDADTGRSMIRPIEIRLLELAAEGKGYKQMAPEIAPTEATVKSKAFKLQEKLGAETIAHAVAIALRSGLIN
jgi:DNA-binding NarL/FixJ family response regulator